MASATAIPEDQSMQNNNWGPQDDQSIGPVGNGQPVNGGASLPVDDHPGQDPENTEYPRGSSVGDVSVSGNNKGDSYRGEKQVKPNKVYIGGLPEHTRQEDLQNCFGKLGKIVNIELKVGYGFVEFENRESAEASVEKYHEGFFMGQKIRVELSHGGGRTAKYAGEPGACFRCGQLGHWARECPSQSASGPTRRQNPDGPLIERIQRDYPGRNAAPRDDYVPRYPPREARYDYPPAAPPRDYRRLPSPGPRDYREYAAAPPRGRGEYDDYRRGPPAPVPVHDRERYPPPPPDYTRGRYPPPPPDAYRGYPGAPPPAVPYDRYDRRPVERYPPVYPPPPSGGRPRSPPLREYDRPPTRDYPDYRGRPVSPPRYANDYTRASAEPPAGRYRRRSLSPGPTRSPVPYDVYHNNGYSGNIQAPRRDYAVPPRSGREIEPSYRRP